MYKRSEKVAETIHEMVSEMLIKGLKDPRIGFVTVTGVKVTEDLHNAFVYFSVVGTEEEKRETAKGLNSARSYIRKELGRNLHMRYIPEVIFRYDDSIEYGSHIDTLLKEIAAKDEEHNS